MSTVARPICLHVCSSVVPGLEVSWARETALGGDRWLQGEGGQQGRHVEDVVLLKPMQIRTFILKVRQDQHASEGLEGRK